MNNKQKEKQVKKEIKVTDVDEHVTNIYDLKKRVGKGAYGIVWKAVHKKTKNVVAVKKIFDAFRNETDAQRTFREIMFLQAFKDHPNIIKLIGLHRATNNKDIYLAFEFVDTDLHHVIKRGSVLKDIHKRYIMYQLFRAIRYIHSGNVIHRDLKPCNVLINAECKIKLADFGLARSLAHACEDEDDGILTDYVATRWYRAPEIIVASKKYTKGVDMWSLGCILGEMLLGKPLFPGSSTVNQLERIMGALPEPTRQEVYNMCPGYGKGLLEQHASERTTLQHLIKSPCDEAMNLVTKLLVFDPNKRLTATEALHHPYVAKFRSGNEPTLNYDVVPLLDDDIKLTVSEYRNKLYELIDSARRKKRQSSTPPSKLSPIEQTSHERLVKQLEKTARQTDYYAQKANYIDSKLTEDKNHRNRQLSSEDIKERVLGKQISAPIKSEIYQKTGSHKRLMESPNQKHDGTRMGHGWIERRLLTSMPKAPQQLKQSFRYEDTSYEVTGRSNGKDNGSSQQHFPFKNALAQMKEKLRQGSNGQLSSTLPKVSHKRDLPRQNSGSPPSVTRYNSKHGVLTTSALQEIRAVLKH